VFFLPPSFFSLLFFARGRKKKVSPVRSGRFILFGGFSEFSGHEGQGGTSVICHSHYNSLMSNAYDEHHGRRFANQQIQHGAPNLDLPQIFEGKCFWLDGVDMTAHANLPRRIVQQGGAVINMRAEFSSFPYHRRCIIASSLSTCLFDKLSDGYIVCDPSWVEKSIESGALLDPKEFSLRHTGIALISSASKASSRPTFQGESTSGSDPRFLEKYLAASRLNKLGLWRSYLLPHLAEIDARLASNERVCVLGSYKGEVVSTVPSTPSLWLHVDLDCFFVQVSRKKRLELSLSSDCIVVAHAGRGKRVSSEASEGEEGEPDTSESSSSVIASCSYPARALGIRAEMRVEEAHSRCEKSGKILHVLDYDFAGIESTSKTVMGILCRLLGGTRTLYPLSCDEAFIDATGYAHPEAAVQYLRKQVFNLSGMECSVGVGATPVLARVATTLAKPNGVHFVREDAQKFLGPMDVSILPGVGSETKKTLKNTLKVSSVKDLHGIPLSELEHTFGKKQGARLFSLARGGDASYEPAEATPKSVSVQATYGVRFPPGCAITPDSFLGDMCSELSRRLSIAGMEASLLTPSSKRPPKGSGKPPSPLLATSLTLKVLFKTPTTVWNYKRLGHGWPVDSASHTVYFSATAAELPLRSAAVASLTAILSSKKAEAGCWKTGDIVGLTVEAAKFVSLGNMNTFVEIISSPPPVTTSLQNTRVTDVYPPKFTRADINEQCRLLAEARPQRKRARETTNEVMIVDSGVPLQPHPPLPPMALPREESFLDFIVKLKQSIASWVARQSPEELPFKSLGELKSLGILAAKEDGELASVFLRTLNCECVKNGTQPWHDAFTSIKEATTREFRSYHGVELLWDDK